MSGVESGTSGWRALWRDHPRAFTTVAALTAVLVAANVWLAARWLAYRQETNRLVGRMSAVERERTDLLAASAGRREQITSELLRRQAATDPALHLAIVVDSGVMRLERDGATLREMRVELGPPATAAVGLTDSAASPGGDPARQLGTRVVERLLTSRDAWEVPADIFAARQLPVPPDRAVPGVLGREALLLEGGTLMYALPDSGLLADSRVLPGAVRLTRRDLRAIAPVILPGTTVYFFQ